MKTPSAWLGRCVFALGAFTSTLPVQAQPGAVQEHWTDKQPPASAATDTAASCSSCGNYGGFYVAGTESQGTKKSAIAMTWYNMGASPAPLIFDKDYWPAPPTTNVYKTEAVFVKAVPGESTTGKCHPFIAGRTLKPAPENQVRPAKWRTVILSYDWMGPINDPDNALGWEYVYGPNTDTDYEPVAMDATGNGVNTAAVLVRVRKDYTPDQYRVLVFHHVYFPNPPSPDWVIDLPSDFIPADLRVDGRNFNDRKLWIAGHSLQNDHYAWRLQGYNLIDQQPAQVFADTTNNFGLSPADCYARAMTFDEFSESLYVTGSSEIFDGPHNALTARYNLSGNALWSMSYPSNTPNPSTTSVASIRMGAACPHCPPPVDWVFVTGSAVPPVFGATEQLMTIAYRQEVGSPVQQQWVQLYNGPANGSDRGLHVRATTQPLPTGEQAVALVTGVSQDHQGFNDWVTLKYNESGSERWLIPHPLLAASQGDSTPVGIEFYLDGFPPNQLFRVFVAGTTGQASNEDVMSIHYEELSP